MVLLTGSMRFAIVNTCYQINKQNIAKYLCENTDKPEMHCDGKCFMNKNLQSGNETPDDQQSKNPGFLYKIDFFKLQNEEIHFEVAEVFTLQNFSNYSFILLESENSKVFRPPIAS